MYYKENTKNKKYVSVLPHLSSAHQIIAGIGGRRRRRERGVGGGGGGWGKALIETYLIAA